MPPYIKYYNIYFVKSQKILLQFRKKDGIIISKNKNEIYNSLYFFNLSVANTQWIKRGTTMTSQEFRKLAGASYDMRFKSEKVRKEINDLEKQMFKVWDNEEKREEYLEISKKIDEKYSLYFEELAKEGLDLRD